MSMTDWGGHPEDEIHAAMRELGLPFKRTDGVVCRMVRGRAEPIESTYVALDLPKLPPPLSHIVAMQKQGAYSSSVAEEQEQGPGEYIPH